jgi:hypothetical protein
MVGMVVVVVLMLEDIVTNLIMLSKIIEEQNHQHFILVEVVVTTIYSSKQKFIDTIACFNRLYKMHFSLLFLVTFFDFGGRWFGWEG